MLTVEIDDVRGIALLCPDGPLSKDDFKSAVEMIDPIIEKKDNLNGLIIYTKSFPGWDSFAALCSHLKFVKEHHKKIDRVAFVTDSVIGNFVEAVASHFVNAEIKDFPYENLNQAKEWAAGQL